MYASMVAVTFGSLVACARSSARPAMPNPQTPPLLLGSLAAASDSAASAARCLSADMYELTAPAGESSPSWMPLLVLPAALVGEGAAPLAVRLAGRLWLWLERRRLAAASENAPLRARLLRDDVMDDWDPVVSRTEGPLPPNCTSTPDRLRCVGILFAAADARRSELM